MKTLLLLSLFLIMGCNDCKDCKEPEAPKEPAVEDKLKDSPGAKRELDAHIKACGDDVVGKYDGNPTSKGCTYKVAIDDIFLENEIVKTGLLHNQDWPHENGVVFTSPKSFAAPEKWSLLDYGVAKEVKKNRQTCGDCWSQASTKGLELIIAATDGKLVDLSVQTQISRCSNHGTCGGGYMSAPQFLVDHGNPFETQDPYKGRNSSCKFSSSELSQGFQYKPDSAPYVGSSLDYSRYFKPENRNPVKIEQIKAAMVKYRSPAIVTLAAISSSGGVINTCSALNSDGNHMQDIVAWDGNVAHVWNSWGTDHGNDGITAMRWDCNGRLNRGLGKAARVYEYDWCENPADPWLAAPKEIFWKTSPASGVWIGRKPSHNQTCTITPADGLSDVDPSGCRAFASPDIATEYHIEAYSQECDDTKSAMVLVVPFIEGLNNERRQKIIKTPHGVVDLTKRQ